MRTPSLSSRAAPAPVRPCRVGTLVPESGHPILAGALRKLRRHGRSDPWRLPIYGVGRPAARHSRCAAAGRVEASCR